LHPHVHHVRCPSDPWQIRTGPADLRSGPPFPTRRPANRGGTVRSRRWRPGYALVERDHLPGLLVYALEAVQRTMIDLELHARRGGAAADPDHVLDQLPER